MTDRDEESSDTVPMANACPYCHGLITSAELIANHHYCPALEPKSPATEPTQPERKDRPMKTIITTVALMLASTLAIAAPKAPAKPAKVAEDTVSVVATCNDGYGWRAYNGSHAGACSGHKGVKVWTDGSPVKRQPLNRAR